MEQPEPPRRGRNVPAGDHVGLSVIVPVYGCAGTLLPLHERLTRVLQSLPVPYEIVLVDDRSRDGAWTVIQDIAADDPHVAGYRLASNVGQQLAITAGLEVCRGRYAVVLDCDLQDPPELIATLFSRAADGFDIVFAKRKAAHQSRGRLLANRLYFHLLGKIVGRPFDGELGALSIISRRVIDAFLQFRERDRSYVMILHTLGFDTATIEYQRSTRLVGPSSYTWSQLAALAVSCMFFTTTRLLHWVIYTGLFLALAGFVWAVVVSLRWLVVGAAPGWTSLVVFQLLVGGVITICLGITGLYVGRIFEEVKRRPLYFIQDRIGGQAGAAFATPQPAARPADTAVGHAPALEDS